MSSTNYTSNAKEGAEELRLVSFSEKPSAERDSYLAFQFNENGLPEIVGEFASVRDKFALISYAEEALARLKRDTFNATQVSLPASCAA